MQDLWTEKYRPQTIEDYVFQTDTQRTQVEQWIKEKRIPHLLLSGGPGTGKSSLARLLIRQLDIHPYDILEINASRKTGIDLVNEKILTFASTMPFGDFKVVFLDEADYISPAGQAALRNGIETYSDNCRFILTCNEAHKVIPALHSRCQAFHVQKLNLTEFTARMAQILIEENVAFDLEVLDKFVTGTYPDLRKCINNCQQNSVTGNLQVPDTVDTSSDYRIAAVELFKSQRYREARELICQQLRVDEINELLRWSYDNLALWSSTPEGQDQAILIIRKAAVNASLVADPEINIAAMLVELSQLESV